MLAHDALYPDAASLLKFIGLHDMPRFLHEQGATAASLKQAFTFLLTTRGIPMIYYGDKIGMGGGDDPDNRRDFPGGWKEDAASAFETSGRSKAQEDLFHSIRELTHLRAATPALRRDALTGLRLEDDAYAFARVTDGSRVVVVFNGAGASAQLHIPLDASGIPNGTRMENLLGTTPAVEARQGALEIQLPPHSAAIYR